MIKFSRIIVVNCGITTMNTDSLRKYGKEMINIVADYWENLRKFRPVSLISPGFINEMVLFCSNF